MRSLWGFLEQTGTTSTPTWQLTIRFQSEKHTYTNIRSNTNSFFLFFCSGSIGSSLLGSLSGPSERSLLSTNILLFRGTLHWDITLEVYLRSRRLSLQAYEWMLNLVHYLLWRNSSRARNTCLRVNGLWLFNFFVYIINDVLLFLDKSFLHFCRFLGKPLDLLLCLQNLILLSLLFCAEHLNSLGAAFGFLWIREVVEEMIIILKLNLDIGLILAGRWSVVLLEK